MNIFEERPWLLLSTMNNRTILSWKYFTFQYNWIKFVSHYIIFEAFLASPVLPLFSVLCTLSFFSNLGNTCNWHACCLRTQPSICYYPSLCQFLIKLWTGIRYQLLWPDYSDIDFLQCYSYWFSLPRHWFSLPLIDLATCRLCTAGESRVLLLRVAW